jgi:hypothetical protein
MGWLLVFVGISSAVSLLAEGYSVWVTDHGGPGSRHVGQLAGWLSALLGAPLAIAALSLMFLLAPDGRLPSRRWRYIARLPIAGLAVWETGLFLTPPSSIVIANQTSTERPLASLFYNIGLLLLVIGLLGSAASLVLRLRRARGETRQQLRWIAFAAACLPLSVVFLVIVQLSNGGRQTWLASAPLYLSFFLLPICIGVAVLRYRLYDLDIIVNRAALLTLATAFAALGYVGLVVGVGAAVGAQGGAYWTSLLGTAVVALAFQPLRRRVVRLADRLAYGEQAAPYEALADFSRRLGESQGSDSLPSALAEAAGSAVAARSVNVRLNGSAEFPQSAWWPHTVSPPEPGNSEDFAVTDGAETLGVISVRMPPGRALRSRDRTLLHDLARQAALAFDNSRLAAQLVGRVAELDRRTAELTESRARIIAARDAERERQGAAIRRDVIGHVEAVSRELERLRNTDRADREAVVGGMVVNAVAALESLREITKGIYPTQLTNYGLAAAIAAHLGRPQLHGSLLVDPTAEGLRFDRRIEAAAYFCYLETTAVLQRPIDVSLAVHDDRLQLRIVGSASVEPDAQRFSDRLEPLGGDAAWTSTDRHLALTVLLPVQAEAVALAGPAE